MGILTSKYSIIILFLYPISSACNELYPTLETIQWFDCLNMFQNAVAICHRSMQWMVYSLKSQTSTALECCYWRLSPEWETLIVIITKSLWALKSMYVISSSLQFNHIIKYASLIALIMRLFQVWKIWNKDKSRDIIDPTISEPLYEEESLRCLQVGLLCVQDFANDRPTMSSIILMLTSEIAALPTPKRPVFTGRQGTPGSDSSYSAHVYSSGNNISITTLEGR